MTPIRYSSIEWAPAPRRHFTGEVEFGPVRSPESDGGLNVLAVRFQPGARTDWHHHPGGQVLHVVEGTCRVGDRDEVVELRAGDSHWTPAGVSHWHGAAPGEAMVHLSITSHGATQWSQDKVSETDYER